MQYHSSTVRVVLCTYHTTCLSSIVVQSSILPPIALHTPLPTAVGARYRSQQSRVGAAKHSTRRLLPVGRVTPPLLLLLLCRVGKGHEKMMKCFKAERVPEHYYKSIDILSTFYAETTIVFFLTKALAVSNFKKRDLQWAKSSTLQHRA